ncbi:hypothetical protein I552_5952 [Mycobacterium xenopi 3993]|nr:hypothetical protein I552_5952 [Mycobacterium xenopi 3993]
MASRGSGQRCRRRLAAFGDRVDRAHKRRRHYSSLAMITPVGREDRLSQTARPPDLVFTRRSEAHTGLYPVKLSVGVTS